MKQSFKNKLVRALLLGLTVTALGSCASTPGGGETSSSGLKPGETGGVASSGASTEQPDPSEGKAKVIILAGQSNAVGQSYCNFLNRQTFTEDRYRVAEAGYPDTMIAYNVNPFTDRPVFCGDFVNVKFGQGRETIDKQYISFGPEIGIAEYLSEAFPGETFYIIKSATGGTDLYDRWNPTRKADNNLYHNMVGFVGDSLKKLEEEGLTPEIIAFCWMQGESDSGIVGKRNQYEYLFTRLISDFKKTFAEYLPETGMSVIQPGITSVWNSYADLNAIKSGMAKRSNKWYYFETTDLKTGTDPNSDPYHYVADDMIILGRRFGEYIQKVIGTLGVPEVTES